MHKDVAHYLPWVGRRYRQGLNAGLRVMILGDSHYSDEDREATRYHLRKHIDFKDRYRFWAAVEQIVGGRALRSPEERREFWDAVAFANFLQTSLDAPGVEWLYDEVHRAKQAFVELVERIEPDVLLVFSKRAWSCLPGDDQWPGSHNLTNVRVPKPMNSMAYAFMLHSGHPMVGGAFNHPRNAGVPLWKWHKWVVRLFAAAREHRH